MIKACRLSISYTSNGNMKNVLEDAMKKIGVTMEDISIKGPDYNNNTHFGNWVLTPVLDNEATERIAKALATKIDMRREYLEQSDIDVFSVGDKVSVQYVSGFGFSCADKGKIVKKENGTLTILKHRSRTKGWMFDVWDEVTLRKIN